MLTYSLVLLRRRLWVVVVAVALAAVAGAQVLLFVAPVQESSASVLFVPSVKEPGVQDPTNPLLSLGGNVAIVASVVQVAVTDDQTQQKLVGDGGHASYTVVPDLGENAGPILKVTADSKDPLLSQRTRDQVVSAVQGELASLQSSQKVPTDLQVSTVVLTSSTTPTVVRKTQIQLGVVVFAVTLLLLLGLVLLVEHRSSRRRQVAGEGADAGRSTRLHRGPAPEGGPVPDEGALPAPSVAPLTRGEARARRESEAEQAELTGSR